MILVTGASGFIGRELIRYLSLQFSVRGVIHNTSLPPRIESIRADIGNKTEVIAALDNIRSVIHAAGLAHQFGEVRNDIGTFQEVNVVGTANVVSAAVEADVQHFILISSVSVYGSSQQPADEFTPCHPNSLYAESKYRAEQVATEIAEGAGMPLTILRLATVYGEGDPGNVARLIRMIDKNRFVWIGHGNNQKSLIHCSDVGRACLAVLTQPPAGTSIYNLSDRPYTMKEIVEAISVSLGKPLPRVAIPASLLLAGTRAATAISRNRHLSTLHNTLQKWVADDVYDATKFCETFDFQPRVPLADGLQREVAWYRQQISS